MNFNWFYSVSYSHNDEYVDLDEYATWFHFTVQFKIILAFVLYLGEYALVWSTKPSCESGRPD